MASTHWEKMVGRRAANASGIFEGSATTWGMFRRGLFPWEGGSFWWRGRDGNGKGKGMAKGNGNSTGTGVKFGWFANILELLVLLLMGYILNSYISPAGGNPDPLLAGSQPAALFQPFPHRSPEEGNLKKRGGDGGVLPAAF